MFFFAIGLLTEGLLAQDELVIQGTWLNGDHTGWIELTVVESELRGRIVGSPDDPQNKKPSRLDLENPNEELRSRELRGRTILSGFHYEGDGRWAGGRVYDPNSGNTYKGTITLVDNNTLKLRGFVGISLFGRTETWTRRTKTM
jgi:hypothetical protein